MQGKVVLITGGGRGIGRASVGLFAKEGAKVAFCARSEGEVLGVAKEIRATGGICQAFHADISSQREVHRMLNQVIETWGRIDLLINNAGVLGPSKPLATYPSEAWDEVIRINLNGTYYVTKAVLRGMIPRRSGCILSLSSSVGRKGRAKWGAYAASKFGLEGMMQVLADEVKPFGIRVIAFNPEATRTRMRAKACPKEDPSSLKSPFCAAKALLYLARSDDPALHGQSLHFSDLPAGCLEMRQAPGRKSFSG